MNYWVIPSINRTEKKEYTLKKVCNVFEISERNLRSRSRLRNFVNARGMLCYILHKKRKLSSVEVSKFLNLNHATVLYHCKNMEGYLSYDEDLKMKYKQLI